MSVSDIIAWFMQSHSDSLAGASARHIQGKERLALLAVLRILREQNVLVSLDEEAQPEFSNQTVTPHPNY